MCARNTHTHTQTQTDTQREGEIVGSSKKISVVKTSMDETLQLHGFVFLFRTCYLNNEKKYRNYRIFCLFTSCCCSDIAVLLNRIISAFPPFSFFSLRFLVLISVASSSPFLFSFSASSKQEVAWLLLSSPYHYYYFSLLSLSSFRTRHTPPLFSRLRCSGSQQRRLNASVLQFLLAE